MKNIGAYEAKTHFSRLLQEVMAGDGYIITHRGQPVAQLLPIGRETGQRAVPQVIADIRALAPSGGETVDLKKLRLEGRR
ncbi:MAG: type II toxin-antitoxin system prevent-host-death family antitoxin [Pseudomonadales bacterium]|jgi:prevent-host-death family protein|nr:type II toxin-antitoxin system prevent-host-death family antitoxin [Pseudomonadales bacterium]MCC6528745.1 type II toxin-antitoxin system prevent-host-death family antitoxin [Pseudomonadales bacterium]MCP5332248.1 type II toxin-antitoxin system prevent-host-death family antitoxin [Pseudomonadales bacterium]HMU91206.1 type II toxin-antitoxin system prevent-host-death family antitoxin [Pseudomonadales bacterium]HMW14229.1 type II toxin-antitoxin system prevent-host-death family antitoxin [Pseu